MAPHYAAIARTAGCLLSFAPIALAGAPPDEPAPAPAALRCYAYRPPTLPRHTAPAHDIWPMEPARAEYRLLSDRAHTTTAHITLQRVHRRSNSSTWRNNRLDQHIELIHRNADGSLQLLTLKDTQNNLLIRFEPPLRLLPEGLPPARPQVTRTDVVVYDRDKPWKIKRRGVCTFSLVYDADQVLQVPAGRFNCRRLRITCEADLGMITLNTSAYLYYADTIGLVAEHYEQVGRYLLFTRRMQRTIVLNRVPEHTSLAAAVGTPAE